MIVTALSVALTVAGSVRAHDKDLYRQMFVVVWAFALMYEYYKCFPIQEKILVLAVVELSECLSFGIVLLNSFETFQA